MKVNDEREQVENASGVRGRKVYELTARRQLVIGLGNSLDKAIQQRFVSATSLYRSRAHNASLRIVAFRVCKTSCQQLMRRGGDGTV